MESNHPCLVFSNQLVKSRKANNHGFPPSENNDNAIIKLCGQKMQLSKMKNLIRKIINQSNK